MCVAGSVSGECVLPRWKSIETHYFHCILNKIILHIQTCFYFISIFYVVMFSVLQDVLNAHCQYCRILLRSINDQSAHSFNILHLNIFIFIAMHKNIIIVLCFSASGGHALLQRNFIKQESFHYLSRSCKKMIAKKQL